MTRFEIIFFTHSLSLIYFNPCSLLSFDIVKLFGFHDTVEKFPTLKITREGKSSTWSGPQRARPAEAAGGLNMIGVIWLKRKS